MEEKMNCYNRLLWLGSFQSEEEYLNMPIPNMGQASALASQKGIIKGIDSIIDEHTVLDTINEIPYPPYPIYPQKIVAGCIWNRNAFSYDESVSYYNRKYVTYYTREQALINAVKKWSKERICKNNVVFVYAPSVGKLKAALYLKKNFGAKVYVIIPDIPEQVSIHADKIIRMAKYISAKMMKKQFKEVDGFILYSANMASYYKLEKNRWMLMEGVFDLDELKYFDKKEETIIPHEENKIRLIYCGALNEFRGIPILLSAFDKMRDREYELLLVGKGESDSLIKECAKKDPRIKHMGFITSREKVIELEKKSDILVHIRQVYPPDLTGYCFPSKLFEYLVSGKPVISVQIPGIPDEYFSYMTKIKDMTENAIIEAVNSVLQKSNEEIQNQCLQARRFIVEKKSSVVQATRILNFAGIKV